MKGLIVSLTVFVLYVLSTMLLAHLLKPQRHSKLFFPAAAAWSPVYFLAFFLTPADLGFLSPAWMANHVWLDAAYGYVVFLLNAHSYIDFFFGFNGGFSMSLMLELLSSGERGVSTSDLVGRYRRADGVDTIYGWRLPRLAETGYIVLDPQTGVCLLTGKGRAVARLTWLLKRILNLGAGG